VVRSGTDNTDGESDCVDDIYAVGDPYISVKYHWWLWWRNDREEVVVRLSVMSLSTGDCL